MIDHLPECGWIPEIDHGDGSFTACICICPALRACEARVEREQMDHLRSHRDEWIADGIKAARDAVAALPSWNYTYGGNPPMVEGPPQYGVWMVKAKALAAIDGLRGEANG